MDELEQLFRESFERHADEVDTTLEVPTKKRQGWAIPLLAAAAAVTAVASSALLLSDDKPESGIDPGPAVVVPAGWRLEQWHGVQVSVPPDWGWGGAPLLQNFDGRGGGLVNCGAAAFVGLGVILTLLAAQLVSPTRRLRLSRPNFRRPQPPKAIEPDTPTAVENAS